MRKTSKGGVMKTLAAVSGVRARELAEKAARVSMELGAGRELDPTALAGMVLLGRRHSPEACPDVRDLLAEVGLVFKELGLDSSGAGGEAWANAAPGYKGKAAT